MAKLMKPCDLSAKSNKKQSIRQNSTTCKVKYS